MQNIIKYAKYNELPLKRSCGTSVSIRFMRSSLIKEFVISRNKNIM